MEKVACDDHEVRFQLNSFVHKLGESRAEVLPSDLQAVLRVT